MAYQEIDLTGGDSVYCINEGQLKRAYKLVREDGESSKRVMGALDHLEKDFSRNEKAALAFVLIDNLLQSRPLNTVKK